jgi:DNA-binding LacI/PurR family transcriptional regulator
MVTVKQIAERAGVSIGTVSNVLNGLSTVREGARKRVMQAVDELGYQPSLLGRALRKDKTNIIVMIVPDITNPFFPGAIRGAEDVAFANGFRLVLCNSDNDVEKETTYMREMQTYRPSGLIIVPAELSRGTGEVEKYLKAGCSVVYMDRIPADWDGDSVASDHERGAYDATKHLIDLGHTLIATITGPLVGTSAEARLRGFQRAMRKAGLRVPRGYVQEADFNKRAGHDKAAILLRASVPPTAIFAANDLIAFGTLAAIREAGLDCPQDISVVGFDNLDDSDATTPTLSTVDQFVYQLGAQAAASIVARMRGESGPSRRIMLAPALRVKESSVAPPKRTRAKPLGQSKKSTLPHRPRTGSR